MREEPTLECRKKGKFTVSADERREGIRDHR